MTTTINADNGVSSGSAGLKSSADSSGVLALQTAGTTAVSISASQVVTLTNALPVASGGTGATTLAGASITTYTGTETLTNKTLTGAVMNGTVGATTPNAGAFTTLSATGVTTVQAGTAALPAITTTGDTNTGIFFPAADTIAFAEGGAEAVRIDSSGNVGIGTSSPSTKLHVVGVITATQGVGGTPAFSAYRATSSQSVSSNTWTKAQLNAEDFDTASAFDSTTNYRFTPQVAGYYLITGSITPDSSSAFGAGILSGIYKNGSIFRFASSYNTSATLASTPVVSAVVYLNGSTDYIELYGYFIGGSGMLFATANNSTAMSGALVRGA